MSSRIREPWTSDMPVIGGGPVDESRLCEHTPYQRYTRKPCSCGRGLWPPRGRGRGEALLSPRRVEAKLKALDALALAAKGYTYRAIARTLGYRTTSGAWQAVQRLRDQEADWARWEARTGRRLYHRHRPSREEGLRALAALEEELATSGLDGQRFAAARERLRQLLLRHITERHVDGMARMQDDDRDGLRPDRPLAELGQPRLRQAMTPRSTRALSVIPTLEDTMDRIASVEERLAVLERRLLDG